MPIQGHASGQYVAVIWTSLPVLLEVNLYAILNNAGNGRYDRCFCGANTVAQIILYRTGIDFNVSKSLSGHYPFDLFK